jgi:hypothetical protein
VRGTLAAPFFDHLRERGLDKSSFLEWFERSEIFIERIVVPVS